MPLAENVWMYSAPLLQQSGVVICPLLMSLDAAACAVAARVMGYPSFSEVILEQQLSPRAVAVMLRQSAKGRHEPRSHRAGRGHGSAPGQSLRMER